MPFELGDQTVADIKEVPDQFRVFYQEAADGQGWELRDDPAVKVAVESIPKLHRSLRAARAEAQGLKGRAADLGELTKYGETVEDIVAAIKAKDDEIEILKKKPAPKGKDGDDDYAERLKREVDPIRTRYETQLSEKQKELEELVGKHVALLKTTEIDGAMTRGGIVKRTIASPLLADMLEVGTYGEDTRVLVKGSDGKPRISPVTGEPLTADELVAEMRQNEDYEVLFASESRTGSGKAPGVGPRVHRGPDRESMTPQQKISYGLKRGQAIGRGTRNAPERVIKA